VKVKTSHLTMRSCCKVRLEIKYRHRQKGLGIATAIFVLTGLALLGLYINRLVETNSDSTSEAIELLGSLYSAESGAQLFMNGLFPPDGSAGGSAFCAASSPHTFTFTTGGLNTCEATLICLEASVDVDGDGTDESYFTVESAGSCGDVTRTIQVRAQ